MIRYQMQQQQQILKQENLLIKQKDYQLNIAKYKKQFQPSTKDPLINPAKKKKGKKSPISFQNCNNKQVSNKGNISDPLMKMNRINKNLQKTQNSSIPTNIPQQQDIKNHQGTPWETILGYFLKVYDYKLQKFDPKIINVFGSQGIKQQQQLRTKLNGGTSMIKKSSNKQHNQTKKQTTICIATYMKILSDMKKQMKQKWKKQDKVTSLQVAIQSLKLLHDTSNAKFHAIKFAHVMQIVDQFGINVFQRIKKLSFPSLPNDRIQQLSIKDLQGSNIPQSAQQICRNWINKISSIRQLVPRAFIQTTLLRLYFFIDGGINAGKILKRLAKSNRCFGQPINCIFFSTFLIRIGKQVLPQQKDFILDILDDVFFYIKQGKSKFHRQDISYDQFFNLLQPFFISSFQSLSQSLSKDKFKRFCQILPQNPHPIILKNFIISFSPSLLVSYSVDIAKMMQKIHSQQKYPIYRILLQRLSQTIFPQSGQFMVLVWTDLSQIKNIEVLLELLCPFSSIIFRNLPRYEKNRFYSLILQSFNNLFYNYNFRSVQKKTYDSFQKFLIDILQKTQDMKDILSLEPFLQIISYFPNQNKRQVSQSISKTFLLRDQMITDPVIVHILLSLIKNMKGMPVNQLALDFISKVDFAGDFQQTLNFLAQMRATFGYLPKVTTALIYKAVSLTFLARKNAKGKITKKLVSFFQATLAYCYITVPILQDSQLKLKLYLYLSQIALANNLISQATSLIKTCITQLSQTNLQSDTDTYKIFHRIISFLIVMPDDPQLEPLFLFNGLQQAFSVTKLKTNFQHIIQFQFYTQCIVYLSCQAQERLPFHIEGVTSNDGLFKSSQFRGALVRRIHEMFDNMENLLKNLGSINGADTDTYMLKNLIASVLTLTSVFQSTIRFTKLMSQLCKIIQKLRERVFRDIKQQKKYTMVIKGLKKRLDDCQIQNKIKCLIS